MEVYPDGAAGSAPSNGTPLAITFHFDGTVAVTVNVAVSAGCSLTGYQAEAENGSPMATAPPDGVRYHPPSPRLAVPPAMAAG